MQTLNTLENIVIAKPVAKKDPYRMGGRKELDALFEQANKDLAEGKCKTLSSKEDIRVFLESL